MEHGASAYANSLCRCDICRAANTERSRKEKARRLARPVPYIVKHGTLNAYSNYGCRCEACRRAQAVKNREYRDKKKREAV